MKRIIVVACCIMLLAPVCAQTNLKTDSLTVTDVKTGLMWMRYDFSYLNKRFLNNWNECFLWQQTINNEKYAGFNDWYVPSISEYRTINHSKADRDQYLIKFFELDTTCVWGKGAYSFWAKNEKGPYNASYISFIDGFATSGDKQKQLASGDWEGIAFGFSVRLVRHIKK